MRVDFSMGYLFNYILFLMIFCNGVTFVSAEPEFTETVDLQMCHDEQLQMNFLCDPEWGLENEGGVVALFIEEDASVVMTLARSEDSVLFLKQLTNPILQEIGHYQSGFSTAITDINGHEALIVQGRAQGDSDVFLSDIYIIHDLILYAISFSINPIDQWDYYKPLVNEISSSISFSTS